MEGNVTVIGWKYIQWSQIMAKYNHSLLRNIAQEKVDAVKFFILRKDNFHDHIPSVQCIISIVLRQAFVIFLANYPDN